MFLDVEMPGASGFDLIDAVGAERMPCVIFVTAFDNYALRAFDVRALDYLLKPFDRDRFRAAVTQGAGAHRGAFRRRTRTPAARARARAQAGGRTRSSGS